MDARQDFYLAALAQCPGLGSRRLGQLLQTGLDAVSLWQMPALEMSRLVKMPQGLVSTIDAFRRDHPDMPEALVDICEQRGVHLCTMQDEDYPYLLKEIFSPPPVLYCRGTLMPKERRVAIVGSRRLSPYGEALALEFGEQLAALCHETTPIVTKPTRSNESMRWTTDLSSATNFGDRDDEQAK